MALGARREDILWATLFSEMRVVLAGIFVGLAANVAVQKLLKDFYTAHSNDAWVLAVCAATMVSVALLAAYLPARHASSIEPMEALRAE
jgi:putative ABC transport system permease protein